MYLNGALSHSADGTMVAQHFPVDIQADIEPQVEVIARQPALPWQIVDLLMAAAVRPDGSSAVGSNRNRSMRLRSQSQNGGSIPTITIPSLVTAAALDSDSDLKAFCRCLTQ